MGLFNKLMRRHKWVTLSFPEFPPNRKCTICGEVQAKRFLNSEGPAKTWWETKVEGDGSCNIAPIKDQGGK